MRAKIYGTSERPRLAVFRSNRQISAQLIDDQKGVTVASATSLKLEKSLAPIEKATRVGEKIAELAAAAKIKSVVFDRRDKKFHGQIKALAEAAKAKGLRI